MNVVTSCSLLLFSIVFLCIRNAYAVDRNNFKTCEQSSFCRRCRNVSPKKFDFAIQPDSVKSAEKVITGVLLNKATGITYYFRLEPLVDDTFRLRINENGASKARYQPIHALISEPVKNDHLEEVERQSSRIIFKSGNDLKVTLSTDPFKVEFYRNDSLLISVNDLGKFVFEHQRSKPVVAAAPESNNKNNSGDNEENKQEIEEGEWEEYFKEHLDSKPYGPMAVAMDFSFPAATHVYGIPMHADRFPLSSTADGQPYRLYNLDVFEYEINNRMALYGSVPMVLAHGANFTTGVFWLNSAETWVDIYKERKEESSTVMETIVNFVSGNSNDNDEKSGVTTHFMSETGIVDVFFLLGPNFYDVSRQYCRLTGPASLPPLFSLGYHQSRWNYFQQDIPQLIDNFDAHDIPVDVIWLDIEYTDGKRYFTWDSIKFPDPLEMQRNLTAYGRKLVVIIDPHIKRDNSYFLHSDATSKGLYVKTKDGQDYEGWCWPGSSSYLDFLNPETNNYYSNLYGLENFPGTTEDVFIWNDMNEPSVFSGPEITMNKDCVHYGNVEHREVHNLYSMLYVMNTYAGLMKRSNSRKRPFILARGHFAGSQRFGAIWTGDNMADWSHLKINVPMCLSSAVAGISFCGADIGGFFKNPDAQLIARWYQVGAYLPFFRAHSHIDTARREPWLFNEATIRIIRSAIKERYALLPLWYTLFYQHEKTGAPIIRPLLAEFPSERAVYDIDHEFLIGDSVLVCPVTSPDVSSVEVYFPGLNEVWYDKDTYRKIRNNGRLKIDAPLDKIPVFYRGGSIIPRKNRVRRSTAPTLNDPYTLIVALDTKGKAFGHLFIDDGESFEYQRKNYLYLEFSFVNNQLSSHTLEDGRFDTKSWLEKVVILGIPNVFTKAIIQLRDNAAAPAHTYLTVNYNPDQEALTIRKPGVNMATDWIIVLQ